MFFEFAQHVNVHICTTSDVPTSVGFPCICAWVISVQSSSNCCRHVTMASGDIVCGWYTADIFRLISVLVKLFDQQKRTVRILQCLSKFEAAHDFLSHSTQQYLPLSEWNCYRSKTWNSDIACASFQATLSTTIVTQNVMLLFTK